MEVKIERENVARKNAMNTYNSEEWQLFLIYMGRHIGRIRFGMFHPDLREE